jgi:hypothetical protein
MVRAGMPIEQAGRDDMWVDTGAGFSLLSTVLFLREVDCLIGEYGQDVVVALPDSESTNTV